MVQSAVAQRPDLQQAGLLVQALEAFRIVEQSGLKPSLAVSLNVQQAIAPNPGQSATQAFAAVQLSWPIRDGGATRARVRSAEEDIAAAEVALEQARLGAALEVRAAATEYLSARESHAVALAGESAAAEALRLADLRYREGVGILLDVISAQSELVRAQRSRSAAFHAAWAAYASLQKAVGADDLDRLAASEPARS
jgi:outer membrane protein TolC